MQKAISYLTQLFSLARVEEFGGEMFHNVCVSLEGTVVLCFTKALSQATVSFLRPPSVSHSLKRIWLDQLVYGLFQDSPSFFQKAHFIMKLSGCVYLRSESSSFPQKSP